MQSVTCTCIRRSQPSFLIVALCPRHVPLAFLVILNLHMLETGPAKHFLSVQEKSTKLHMLFSHVSKRFLGLPISVIFAGRAS